jgi:flagellar biosynthesis protein FlhF
MNVKRFVGKTSGEAMRKLREALGPDALVLANRPCAEGIELLAAAPGGLGGLDADVPREAAPAVQRTRIAGGEAGTERPARQSAARGDADVLPESMSTVSFQDYVRQRLRERSQAGQAREAGAPVTGTAALAATAAAAVGERAPRPAAPPARAAAAADLRPQASRGESPAVSEQRARLAERAVLAVRGDRAERAELDHRDRRDQRDPRDAGGDAFVTKPSEPAPRPMRREPSMDALGAPPEYPDAWSTDTNTQGERTRHGPLEGFVRATQSAQLAQSAQSGSVAPTSPPATAASNAALVAEMQSLKGMISRQFATISWFEGVRRSPTQGRLLRAMVAAGFSLKLARSVVTRLPSDYAERDAQVWLEEVLARNLRCATPSETFEAGGVFALIGATGVGKTTTTAKIAARHVLKHGPQSVALITVDTYRLGAHDQLRAFGRILGVPVHIAHDAAALHDLLRLRATRQLVLIDTVGMGHRDERIRTLLTSLPRNDIKHVVVASCASQAETIDESLRAYEARLAHGVILTKLDEAARTGGALDCMLRQRLRLLGVCDGQRVPEDWQPADAGRLVRRALLASPPGAFGLDDEELPLVFGVAATLQGDTAHA